jgi:hypothetical protein
MIDGDEDKGPGAEFQEEIDAFLEGASGLFESLKDIFAKSKEEIVRGARQGKVRIDVYQLRKDREHFLQRLGEQVYALMVDGALSHDDLQATFVKVQALDEQIATSEEEIERLEAESEAARAEAGLGEAANEAAEAEVVEEPAAAAEEPAAAEAPAPKKATKKKASKAKKAAASKDDGAS